MKNGSFIYHDKIVLCVLVGSAGMLGIRVSLLVLELTWWNCCHGAEPHEMVILLTFESSKRISLRLPLMTYMSGRSRGSLFQHFSIMLNLTKIERKWHWATSYVFPIISIDFVYSHYLTGGRGNIMFCTIEDCASLQMTLYLNIWNKTSGHQHGMSQNRDQAPTVEIFQTTLPFPNLRTSQMFVMPIF